MGTIARTDVELVAASLRGEHDAFGHLVARYQDVVCAVSYSSTGDRNLSEDVAQETFIAAWSQLDRLRDRAAVRSWLCGMARNIARKARKRLRREELVEADERAAEGNPFDDAARGDAERIVREALSRIPDGCREVLVLYYREDLSVKEIAETLGTNEVAVMQRLSRGRRYLADGVTELVERSLRGERRRRDLVAAVLASIAAIAIPSRVDASPLKGSTMLKAALAVTAVAAVGGAVYLGTTATKKPSAPATSAALHFGNGKLGLAHAPALGPTAAPRAIHSRSVAQSDLALLPADAEAVIGINLAQMRGSALWQNLIASHVANDPATERFKTLCGFDPLQSIDSVAIGVSGLGPAGPSALSGTIVIHGLPKARAMTCFDEHGIKASEEDGSKVTIDHDTVLITANNQHFAFTFIDDSTALLVLGPAAATRDSVAQIAAGGGTLATAGKYVETLSYVNTDDSLWFMLAEGSPMVTMINLGIAQYTPAKLGTVYAALNMTDSVAIDAGLRLQSPEAVAALVQRFQDQLADPKIHDEVARHFDQLDVAADGSDLIISLAISGDELAKVIKDDVQVTTN